MANGEDRMTVGTRGRRSKLAVRGSTVLSAATSKEEKPRTKGAFTDESVAAKKRRVRRILAALHKLYPAADCALRHNDPLQLLIATILSAQCTDETVNKVTPVLFARFPTAQALGEASREELEAVIHSTGFFRQKAKSIQATCRKLVAEFDGQVPDTMEALVTLSGVARKTANVVLGTAFGKNEGVVVDTHVGRLATRLGLTWSSKDTKDAVKIERDLMDVVPREEWTFVAHALIGHGRLVCSARKPDCPHCTLAGDCPSAGTFEDAGTPSPGRLSR